MWLEIGIGLTLLLLLLQSAALFLLWHRLHQLRLGMRAIADDNLAHAYTDVPTSMLVTMLSRLEQRLSVAEQPLSPSGVSYELAQKLAREGADVEQLIHRCGLSRDEAVLVRQLHPALR